MLGSYQKVRAKNNKFGYVGGFPKWQFNLNLVAQNFKG